MDIIEQFHNYLHSVNQHCQPKYYDYVEIEDGFMIYFNTRETITKTITRTLTNYARKFRHGLEFRDLAGQGMVAHIQRYRTPQECFAEYLDRIRSQQQQEIKAGKIPDNFITQEKKKLMLKKWKQQKRGY